MLSPCDDAISVASTNIALSELGGLVSLFSFFPMEIVKHLTNAADALLPHLGIHEMVEDAIDEAFTCNVDPCDDALILVEKMDNLVKPCRWMISAMAKQLLEAHKRAPESLDLDAEALATLENYRLSWFDTAGHRSRIRSSLYKHGLMESEEEGIFFIVEHPRLDYLFGLNQAVSKARFSLSEAEFLLFGLNRL